MKKIFSVLAAAIIALSFTSCGEKGGATGNGFKITVSDVTATTAHIAIEPNNKDNYYVPGVYMAEAVAKYTADSIAISEFQKIYSYVQMGYGLDVLAQYGYVFKGDYAGDITGLPSKTNLTIIVFEIKQEGQLLVLGNIATKTFTTKDVEKKGEKTLTLTDGELDDYCESEGWWQLQIADKDTTVYLSISPIEADQLAGTWTIDDMDPDYTVIIELEGDKYAEYGFVTFNATTTAENDLFKLTGKGIAENGIEYTLNLSAPIEPAGQEAPAKVARFRTQNAEGLVKQTLSVKRFVK